MYLKNFNFKTTEEIVTPKKLIDQVIGQEQAVEIIRKAAAQKRNVLLIGEPGTGKSLLGNALAELLPKEKLVDVLVYPNLMDENQPLIRTVAAGKGKEILAKSKIASLSTSKWQGIIFLILSILVMAIPWWIRAKYKSDIMFAAFFLGGIFFLGVFTIFMSLSKKITNKLSVIPKLIIDNSDKTTAPFIDATGAHAGALLGDVLHDPLQSGGLGTPAHDRVIPGMIHKANGGVLFIDEISTLSIEMQQELLTAMQDKKFPITGRSERSSGAMTRTEPVPTDFILVAAGNLQSIQKMHPALRSRIRGYGYEVFMKETMPDTLENRFAIARFIAQEVAKDKKIPHFTKEAVEVIIDEAKRMANRSNHLTVRFRELGGLIRAAGDIAKEANSKYVKPEHILKAKQIAKPLEKQISDRIVERKKEYEVIITSGSKIGRVNGLAVVGSYENFSGIVLPIESEVVLGGKEKEIVATGNLGKIAKEAIKNVSAIIKKYFAMDLKKYNIYVQFIQTYEGVEGDSASIAVAASIISSLKNVAVRQDTALTGSLSVRGNILPVGGITTKVEAAIEAGLKRVIIPEANLKDLNLEKFEDKIKIIPVKTIIEALNAALVKPLSLKN